MQLTRRQRRYLIVGGAAVAVGFAAYQLSRADGPLEATRAYFRRLRAVLLHYLDALAVGAETLHRVLADLQAYLASEAAEPPASLRQLARLLASQEASSAATAAVSATVRGVVEGIQFDSDALANSSRKSDGTAQQQQPRRAALDRVIDAALSERGQSLVAVAVSLGARNLVSAFLETQHALSEHGVTGPRGDVVDRVLTYLSEPGGQQLVALATGAFVSNGVRVIVDENKEVNVYEDLFASIAKPGHLQAVTACVGTFAREAVAAAVAGCSGGEGGGAATTASEQQHRPAVQRTLIEELPAEDGSSHVAAAVAQQAAISEETLSRASSLASPAPERVDAWMLSRHDDLDSDSLLHTSQSLLRERRKAGSSSSRADAGGEGSVGILTPLGANSPVKPPQHPAVESAAALIQQRQVQLQPTGNGSGSGWAAAMVREWCHAARDPVGREVCMQMAGVACREAAAGASSALVQRLDASWLVLASFAVLLFCWLALQLAMAVLVR